MEFLRGSHKNHIQMAEPQEPAQELQLGAIQDDAGKSRNTPTQADGEETAASSGICLAFRGSECNQGTGCGRSSRQGCSPTGESPVVSVARVGHVAIPHPGEVTTQGMRGV